MTPLFEPRRLHHHPEESRDGWGLFARVAVAIPATTFSFKAGTQLQSVYGSKRAAEKASEVFQAEWQEAVGIPFKARA